MVCKTLVLLSLLKALALPVFSGWSNCGLCLQASHGVSSILQSQSLQWKRTRQSLDAPAEGARTESL
ncbi:hypothetical protein GJAV_G00039200 [Gymnothorax javanicus]|nr:hypothetical protein GJAV_G00039200 [Gymnothorax javanicus]